jgi:SAM-dependent methyltransferase
MTNPQQVFFNENQEYIARKIAAYRLIIAKLNINKEMRILDFGCGFGEMSKALNSFHYDGFDIDQTRIQLCKSKNNLSHNFFCQDILNHKFNINYDIILSITTLDEIQYKFDYLTRINELMPSNSKFYLEVRNKDYFMNNLPLKLSNFFELIGLRAKQYSGVKDLNYFEYLKLIDSAGFEILEESVSIQPMFTRTNLLKNKSFFIQFSNLLSIRHRYSISFTLVKKGQKSV